MPVISHIQRNACGWCFRFVLLVVLVLPFAVRAEGAVPHSVPATVPGDPEKVFQSVDLKELVPASRMALPGQRAYFVPVAVKFRARLAALPAPVKTKLLEKSFAMMQVVQQPQVRQAIGLDYGGEKALLAYIEETVAARLGKELKTGDERLFYAYHVYNFHQGPALLVMSFE